SNNYVPDLRTALRDALARAPGGTGFDVKLTGYPALDSDIRSISAEDTARGEQRVLPVTLVVLVLAFGALVAALLPIAVGVLAITIALGLVTLAAKFQTMSVFVLNITTMVGLGVGIDYSLLVVTRFREELNRGLSAFDAAVRTVQTAGAAVVTSGLTVALLSFPLTQIRIGVPARNWFPPESESGQGLAELQEMGASGVIQPTRVVIQLPEGESALSPLRLRGLKTLSDSLRKDPRVKEVRGVATIRPGMSSLQL